MNLNDNLIKLLANLYGLELSNFQLNTLKEILSAPPGYTSSVSLRRTGMSSIVHLAAVIIASLNPDKQVMVAARTLSEFRYMAEKLQNRFMPKNLSCSTPGIHLRGKRADVLFLDNCPIQTYAEIMHEIGFPKTVIKTHTLDAQDFRFPQTEDVADDY